MENKNHPTMWGIVFSRVAETVLVGFADYATRIICREVDKRYFPREKPDKEQPKQEKQ